MAMFDKTTILSAAMEKELSKVEFELADGSTVSNLEAICQNLIGRALDGDLNVVQIIAELTSGKK